MPPAQRPAPRDLIVLANRQVTRHMQRLTLGGPGLADFPPGREGGYVKLMLPPAAGTERPLVRTYTIRDQRPGEIDVDFALHGAGDGSLGPATRWATAAQPGATILVGGPGPAKPLPPGFERYLIAGDMTALPAISVNLERLDRGARGLAVITILDETDRQEIDHPSGVELVWLVNPEPGTHSGQLADHLRAAGWPDERVYAWAASEFSAMRALRAYLHEERGLGREQLYISSYWKHGDTEDLHKQAKRADAEAAAS